MGFAISWLAVRDRKENSPLDVLGLEKIGETEEIPESEWSTTRIGDWTVVWSDRFEPKKFRDARLKLKGEVIVCDVEEHVMYASVAAFKDGNLSWRIVHDAQQASDHLLLEGAPPRNRSQRFNRNNLRVSARIAKLTLSSTFPFASRKS